MTHAALKDLLPCPFCGKPANFDAPSELYGSPYFAIRCCVAHSKGYDQQEVGAAWNRRTALSAMEGEAVAGWIEEQDAERLRNKGPGFVSCAVEVWPNENPGVRRQTEVVRHVPIYLAAPPPQQAEKCGRCDGTSDPICRRCETEIYAATHPAPSPGPQGYVVVTTDDAGRCVMVSRQDDEHRILSVIWEAATPPAHQPGEVGDIERTAAAMWETFQYRGKWPGDASSPEQSQFRKMAAAVLAALAPKEAGHDR